MPISENFRVGEQVYDSLDVFLGAVRIANVPVQEFIRRVSINRAYNDFPLAISVIDQTRLPGLVSVGFTPTIDGDWEITIISNLYSSDWRGSYRVRGTDPLSTYSHVERTYQFVQGLSATLASPLDFIRNRLDAAITSRMAAGASVSVSPDPVTQRIYDFVQYAEAAISSPKALIRLNLDAQVSTRSTLTQAQIISDSTTFLGGDIAKIYSQVQGSGATESGQLEKLYNFAQGVESRDSIPRSRIDASVSSRSTLTQAQILSDAVPFAGADVAVIKTVVNNFTAYLGYSSVDSYASLASKENELLRRLTDNRATYLDNLSGSNVAHDDKLQTVLVQVRKLDLDPVTAVATPSGSILSYLEAIPSATDAAKTYNLLQGGSANSATMQERIYNFVQGAEAALSGPKDLVRTRLDAAISTRATPSDILSDATAFKGGDIAKIYSLEQGIGTTNATQLEKVYNFIQGIEADLSVPESLVRLNLDARVSSRSTLAKTDIVSDSQAFAGAQVQKTYDFVQYIEQGLANVKDIVRTRLDVAISSRSTLAQSDILSDATPFKGGDVAKIYSLLQGSATTDAGMQEKIYNFVQGIEGDLAQSESLIRGNLDAKVSSRSTLTQAQILSDATPFAGADVAVIKTVVNNLTAYVGYSAVDAYASVGAKGNELLRRLTDDRARYLENLSGSNVAHDDKLQIVLNQVRKIDLDPVIATAAPAGTILSYLENVSTGASGSATLANQTTILSNIATLQTDMTKTYNLEQGMAVTNAALLEKVYNFQQGVEAALSNPKDIIRTRLDVAVSTRSTLTQAQVVSDSTPFLGGDIAKIYSQVQGSGATDSALENRIYNFVQGIEADLSQPEALVRLNLDAKVSSRSTLAQSDILSDATPFKGGDVAKIYTAVQGIEADLAQSEALVRLNLDAKVSTRSTLAQSDVLSDAIPFKGGDMAKVYAFMQNVEALDSVSRDRINNRLDVAVSTRATAVPTDANTQKIYDFVQYAEVTRAASESLIRTRLDVAVSTRATAVSSDPNVQKTYDFVQYAEAGAAETRDYIRQVYLNRLTSTRAGYLDYLAGSNVAHDDKLQTVLDKVKDLSTTGQYSVTIRVTNVSTGARLSGVLLTLADTTDTNSLGSKTTNGDGEATFSLEAGTYKVRLSVQGFSFSTPQTLTVVGNATVVYTGGAFSPTLPADPTKCTIYGWVTDAQGVIQSGVQVKFTLVRDDVFTSGGKSVRKKDEIVTTDSSGYFEIALFRSSNLIPTDAKYRAAIPAIGFSKDIKVPDLSTEQLKNLV